MVPTRLNKLSAYQNNVLGTPKQRRQTAVCHLNFEYNSQSSIPGYERALSVFARI